MFCANCGKKIDDDVQFCPHCGAKAEAAQVAEQPSAAEEPESAVPAEPAPVEPAPEPEPTPTPEEPPAATPQPETAHPPTPEAPAPGPAAGTPPPTTTPPEQPAAPPPAGTVPPAAEGEAPKKKSSSCWIIGCVILAVVVILGGVGTCLGLPYAARRGSEAMQDFQQQLEEQGVSIEDLGEGQGGEQSGEESGDEGEEGTGSGEEGEGGSESPLGNLPVELPSEIAEAIEGAGEEWQEALENIEAAMPQLTLHQFLLAWQLGNTDQAREYMTAELSADLSDQDLAGHTQLSINVKQEKKISSSEYEYVVEREIRTGTGSDSETVEHRVRLKRVGDDWKVSELEELSG